MSHFFSTPRPRVFGHRGAAGLAPENTLPSFALALALGADILEFDVHGTKDGEVVIFHDPTLDRTTNGEGEIREHTLAQLRRLDAGFHFTRDGSDYPFRGNGIRVPTLTEWLTAFPHALANVEIKQGEPGIAEEVVAILRRHQAEDRFLLAAERDAIMSEVRRCAGGILTGFCVEEVVDFIGRLQGGSFDGYAPQGKALQIPVHYGDIPLVTAESVAAAHAAGLEVHVWTINDAEEMRRLLDLGVDGIISDLPGLARRICDARS